MTRFNVTKTRSKLYNLIDEAMQTHPPIVINVHLLWTLPVTGVLRH